MIFVCSAEPGGFTPADLARLPDDGRRVELLDGVALVRPALTPAQRQIVRDLYLRLCDTCPTHLMVVDGPHDVRVGPATVLRPDITVLPRGPAGDDDPRGGARPELVVELRPDTSATGERSGRMRAYRDAGIPSCWIVDPAREQVAVYELKFIKRDITYHRDEICERGHRYGWRLWASRA
jgi:Uma2 family endonuclease